MDHFTNGFTVLLVFGIIQAALILAVSDVCKSRSYCDAAEIRYRAFLTMNESYLNSKKHVINSLITKDAEGCMKGCLRTDRCESVNHYFKFDAMICDLLRTNKWANAGNVERKRNSTHYYFESSCSSNPCKNDGKCLPSYQDSTYNCDCGRGSHAKTITGSNCEIVEVAEQTSQVYYNFDQELPIDTKSIVIRKMRIHGTARILPVPDRKSPVVYLPGTKGNFAGNNGYGKSDCITYIPRCKSSPNDGLSVSLWFRILRRAQIKFQEKSGCHSKYIVFAQTTDNVGKKYGFRLFLRGCVKNAFVVQVRDRNRFVQVQWGNAHAELLCKRWSHILFTYKYTAGLRLYFNGVEVERKTTLVPKRAIRGNPSGNILHIGNSAAADLETYVDDFAAWYKFLSSADVQLVYHQGLKRNTFV